MSKRCELQKEYYKEFGNYKGDGKYLDDYVKWLENEVLALRIIGQSEQLVCPECENPYPHLHIDGSRSCEDCGHEWAG